MGTETRPWLLDAPRGSFQKSGGSCNTECLRQSGPLSSGPPLLAVLSTENVRLPPASPQRPGESFSHRRGPKSLFRSQLERPHSRAYPVPSERGILPPKGPKVCMQASLELCNGEAPLPVPHFPASRWRLKTTFLGP